MSIDPVNEPAPGFTQGQIRDADRLLSDGTLYKENPNEHIQFTANTDDFEEHITVPKDNPQAAHASAYQDGDKIGQEPLDE
ncbi:hypothetical protein Huta_1729 [Halorhabdus utahensis DSM 12940]|uniref:Uncharacterized protein n=1 Tax=Halorhabdus utahensis (strain DSM 12940 / JCM 11049 / AX-2) TaxID=519442 RepID=C7NQZ7_HALUD|nr:hypothetical protein [Halorhabdus utahensis]ACV11901.1 hypothetical protein Huta_1729 [Halorhabdus utahensis DSM 12940]